MAEEIPVDRDYDAVALTLREQERLGQELHDTLGPQLTAISMLAASLLERLQSRAADETGLAAKLLSTTEQAKIDVRSLTKGLLPVDCDAEGLMSALRDLADQTEETHDVSCHFECAEPVIVRDNFTATRLYRIAKEAVHNAVKHGRPKQIVIKLTCDSALELQIRDDGLGIGTDTSRNEGNGMRIMRHRCELIGGAFDIRSSGDDGTAVTCIVDQGAP